MPDNVLILLVLVVRAVRLDDAAAVDAVDGTGDAAGGDEPGEITVTSFISMHLGAAKTKKRVPFSKKVQRTGQGNRP